MDGDQGWFAPRLPSSHKAENGRIQYVAALICKADSLRINTLVSREMLGIILLNLFKICIPLSSALGSFTHTHTPQKKQERNQFWGIKITYIHKKAEQGYAVIYVDLTENVSLQSISGFLNHQCHRPPTHPSTMPSRMMVIGCFKRRKEEGRSTSLVRLPLNRWPFRIN